MPEPLDYETVARAHGWRPSDEGAGSARPDGGGAPPATAGGGAVNFDDEIRARAEEELAEHEECGSLGSIPDYPVEALPQACRELVEAGVADGLPAGLLGGAALAALAGAIGGAAELEIAPSWQERAILWVALVAPRGAGKSPAQDCALAPLRAHDAALAEEGADAEEGQAPVCIGDTTIEALARHLAEAGGAVLLDLDELAVLLRGLSEYKRRGGGDRDRLLGLWSGAPWRYTRVGGGQKRNEVSFTIARPTLAICGGLQPARHGLLGGEEDGLRPRWLPHLAELPPSCDLAGEGRSVGWQTLLGRDLLPARRERRVWRLTPAARRVFESRRKAWKAAARGDVPAGVAAALVKADTHLVRVALCLAEAESPARGGDVGEEIVERAAAIVEYVLASWAALPGEEEPLALSRRDASLDRAVDRLAAWLEERGGPAARGEILRAHVAGCRTASDLDALLDRYERVYPGSVVEEEVPRTQGGGSRAIYVYPPRRVAKVFTTVATVSGNDGEERRLVPTTVAVNSGHASSRKPHNEALFTTVATVAGNGGEEERPVFTTIATVSGNGGESVNDGGDNGGEEWPVFTTVATVAGDTGTGEEEGTSTADDDYQLELRLDGRYCTACQDHDRCERERYCAEVRRLAELDRRWRAQAEQSAERAEPTLDDALHDPKVERRAATAEEEAELERLRAKFPDLAGGRS